MKKRDDSKKEAAKKKLKKIKGSTVNKRTNQRVPDPWKEIRLKLKPLGKAYNKFREKRRIAKQKEEQKRLKFEEEQRLREGEALKLQEQEERKLRKRKILRLINEETMVNQISGKRYVRILNLSARHIINSERNGELQNKKMRKEG